jgi:hypothetical protein
VRLASPKYAASVLKPDVIALQLVVRYGLGAHQHWFPRLKRVVLKWNMADPKTVGVVQSSEW